MGKNKFKGGRGGRGGGRGGGGGGGQGRRGNWGERTHASEIDRTNKKFEDYYNNLGIVDEEEQEAFWDSMRSDLPNSFRFTGSRGQALVVQRRLIDHYIPMITAVEYEGEKVAPPEPVQWYPHQLAWSMTTPKNVIRRHPPFAAFQKFLVSENGVGNITRQELVSMIPPLFMDIKPGMAVLDLCAAPGSKSAQILEMVHGGEEARVRKVLEQLAAQQGQELGPADLKIELDKDLAESESDYADDGRSTGLLVANDKDYKRAQMLVHQTKRLNSPNIIVTNHDATTFPSLKIPSPGAPQKYLKFDRILADVPCSGDGTTRKNLDIWRAWTVANGLGLHSAQVRILVRSMQMLKVGGRVVYSTCSLNPIENEAVVAEAIARCGGTDNVAIVNTAGMLPDLKRREGLRSWTVMDRNGQVWSSHDDVKKHREGTRDESLDKLSESCFPPPPEAEIPLHRCMRVYPHFQDTGGFFIAVLEKRTEIKVRQEPSKTASSFPAAEDAPVSAAVEEIQSKDADATKTLTKVDAADNIPNGNSEHSAAHETSRKRELGDQAEDEPAAKRAKADVEVNGTSQSVPPEQQEHWPPPPAAPANVHPNGTTTHAIRDAAGFAPGKKKGSGQPQEEAFKYLDWQHPELQSIYKFYQLSSRFPRDRFMVRNASGNPAKAIYYTSDMVRSILTENEGKGIKFVHSGVKMFVKQDIQGDPDACKWRIQTEGLPLIESWVGPGRVVRLYKRAVLRKLLVEMFPRTAGDDLRELCEVGEQVRDLGLGCCMLRIEPDGGADGFDERWVMPLWRGVASINLMLPKEDRKAMLLRLFNDESPLIDTHKRHQDANKQSRASPDRENDGGNTSSEDDGGVLLTGASAQQMAMPEAVAVASADTRIEAAENVAERESQHAADTHKKDRGETIDGDEDTLNKTV